MAAAAGYSGTPLAKKLGITAGCRVHLRAAPPDWSDWVAPLPEGVQLHARLSALTDLVHLFATQEAELARQLQHLRTSLRPDAVLWVSWPKKSAKQTTHQGTNQSANQSTKPAVEITEDRIRAVALPLGFVDVKVCAVNEVWSGLKLVVRKVLR